MSMSSTFTQTPTVSSPIGDIGSITCIDEAFVLEPMSTSRLNYIDELEVKGRLTEMLGIIASKTDAQSHNTILVVL